MALEKENDRVIQLNTFSLLNNEVKKQQQVLSVITKRVSHY